MITFIAWQIIKRIPDEKLDPGDIWYAVAFTFLLDISLFVFLWGAIAWKL